MSAPSNRSATGEISGGPSANSGDHGSLTSLRVANQRRVLDAIFEAKGAARQAEIVRATGLATGTVSSIIRELADARVIDTVAGAGRRSTVIRLGRGAGLVAGIDFGHTHVAVALADLAGNRIATQRELSHRDQDAATAIRQAARLLNQALVEADADASELRTIGMGLPAPISNGVVMSSAILPGWIGLNAVDVVRESFGVDVHIENDANLGALAEHRVGAAQGHDDLVFVKVSSGVGAGLLMGGRIVHGANGTAGEIGHLTMDDRGPLCRCGSRGCLEAYASTGNALAMMAEQLPGADLDEIIEAAKGGNIAAARVFEDAGIQLGLGLAAVTNLFNPGMIVIGGDMAHAGDLLLEPTRGSLRRHVLAASAATPIVATTLGDEASVIGAVLLAIEKTDLLQSG